MKNTYSLPVKVFIESDQPDSIMKAICETMYDAVKNFIYDPKNEFDNHVKHFDMEWSIYKKADEKIFGYMS